MIDELVEEIRRLSPAVRRQLLRRLRINGLLDADEALTDQNRLTVATAMGGSSTNRQTTTSQGLREPSASPAPSSAPSPAPSLANPTSELPVESAKKAPVMAAAEPEAL